MQGMDHERRREETLLTRLTANRTSVLAVAGVVIIAVIALAFVLNPGGESPADAKSGPVAKPTSAPAAVVPVASPTAAATAAPSVATKAGGRIHEVASGDTLMEVAKKYYGDPMGYEKIFEANKDILDSPDSLQIGQKLKIPD